MALNVLAGIARQTTAPAQARVAAANSLLDRGWGRADTTGNVNVALAVHIRAIEHSIVEPKVIDAVQIDSAAHAAQIGAEGCASATSSSRNVGEPALIEHKSAKD